MWFILALPSPPPLLNLGPEGFLHRCDFLASLTARAHAVRSSVCLSSCAFINERNLLDMMKFSLTVSLAILLQVISVLVIYTSGSKECIKGKWHKASPSPETDEFKTCHAFKDNSCCTAEFTVELMANETRNLYNHSWDLCGQLSEKCQQFWVTQVGLILCDLIFCWFARSGSNEHPVRPHRSRLLLPSYLSFHLSGLPRVLPKNVHFNSHFCSGWSPMQVCL